MLILRIKVKGFVIDFFNMQNLEMWLLSHDAVCLADPPYLSKVLAFRDYQRAVQSNTMMTALYDSLQVFF